MKRSQLAAIGVSALTSFGISCAFVLYGADFLFRGDPPIGMIAFGVMIAAYGLSSLTVLVMTFLGRMKGTKKITSYLAAGCMAVFFTGALDSGRISGLEITALLLAAVMLSINWFAVNAVAQMRQAD